MHGYFQQTSPGRAVIKIATNQSAQQMEETLLEEYAHLLRSDCPIPVPDDEPHDSIFWAILGELTTWYRNL